MIGYTISVPYRKEAYIMEYLKKNYHTHTTRCGHASGKEREYIENAIEAGIQVLGFADHTPYPFDVAGVDYKSGVRMDVSLVEDYVTTLSALREEYKDRIKILIGFEAEYYPLCFEGLCKIVKDYNIDYLILGQHFTNNEFDGTYAGRPCTTETFKSYIDSVITAIETGYFSYIAHPDMVNYTEDDEVYKEEMTRLCKRAKELDIPLEINFLGFHESRRYPCERFFKIAAEIGNKVIYGVDAHVPTFFTDTAETFKKVEEFRKNLGLELTDEINLISGR
ncbi:MAG: histidinol-phosphatase HisJ family protein [Ruminococcaceae bacterium]|nr:histidinol-phosphatase HisJ family protein [Oscillospiraceae bacterium]